MMKTTVLTLSAAILAVNAHAQQAEPTYIQSMPVGDSYASSTRYSFDGDRNWELSLGLAALLTPEYSGSDEMETHIFPMVRGQYHIDNRQSLYVEGLEAGYRFTPNEMWEAGIALNYRAERDNDTQELNGMPDIDATFEMGPFVRYNLSSETSVGLKVAFDVKDEHDGYVAVADIEHQADLPIQVVGLNGKWMYGAGAKLVYGSENYMETYYGVTSSQATASRPAYSPDAGISELGVNGNIIYAIDEKWFVMGMAGAEILLENAADSSIVENELQPFLMMTVGYKF